MGLHTCSKLVCRGVLNIPDAKSAIYNGSLLWYQTQRAVCACCRWLAFVLMAYVQVAQVATGRACMIIHLLHLHTCGALLPYDQQPDQHKQTGSPKTVFLQLRGGVQNQRAT
jgi:hypothetical protein